MGYVLNGVFSGAVFFFNVLVSHGNGSVLGVFI